jgi:protein-tyrosine phosphatase
MIDLHCHILPNLDDGPSSIDESLAMARRAEEDGIRMIVATPHTLNGVYLNPVDDVSKNLSILQEALSQNHIDVTLYPGADVHLCPNMVKQIEAGEAGTINHAKKYIILELPSHTIPSAAKDEIFKLKASGITPIISHPERNAAIHQDSNILYDLICMGALGQVTAMSLTGDFGLFVQQTAARFINRRLIHIIASDAHSSDGRPPVLSKAVDRAAEILGSDEEAVHMVTTIPAAIIAGERIDISEPARNDQRSRVFL